MDEMTVALSKDSAECTDEPLPDTLTPEEVQAQTDDRARRVRNDLRAKLATDPVFAHQWLCHDGRKECEVSQEAHPFGGCEHGEEPARWEFYVSPWEFPAGEGAS